MAFTYSRLWDLLRHSNISKTDLAKRAGFTSATLAKLGKDQNVNMDVLDRICQELSCNLSDIVEYVPQANVLRTVSLFAGIGGFEEALSRAKLKAKTVFASEIDKHAVASYSVNFPRHPLFGDITKIPSDRVPGHDLLVAGFPCQAFSIAGRRRGFEDTRGTLFFDIERIINLHQPKYILLENVKNLISHDGGNTINTILTSLNRSGYIVDFTVINSKEAGLPQSRERTYIIGIRDIEPEKYEIDPRNKRVNRLKSTLNESSYRGFNFFNSVKYTNKTKTLADIIDEDVEDKYYLSNDKVKKFISTIKVDFDDVKYSSIRKLFDLPKDVHNDNERQRRVYSINGISPTILARSDSTKILINDKGQLRIRKITPIEALRAQGFSEEFIHNIISSGASQTQLYKQAGNAVSPPVVSGIIELIGEYIEKGSR